MAARNIVPPSNGYHFDSRDHYCPICGKLFIPAPYHYWKINGTTGQTSDGDPITYGTLVCTYSCMRKWERSHGRVK